RPPDGRRDPDAHDRGGALGGRRAPLRNRGHAGVPGHRGANRGRRRMTMLETPIFPPAEWNDTAREYPAILLHEAFERQVERSPDAIALRFRDATLSYRQLSARADELAGALVTLGAGPNSLVAVCMERSLEMVVALYAKLKAGAAYVPIDPEYPADRIEFMLEDTAAPILLTQPALAERFRGA